MRASDLIRSRCRAAAISSPSRTRAKYIQKLPRAEQQLAEWQTAVEAMLLVVEHNGPTMMARIGVMRALNRGHLREFDTSRKDTHWGKRKLTRALHRLHIWQRTIAAYGVAWLARAG